MFQHIVVLLFQLLLLSVGVGSQVPADQFTQAFSYAFFPCVYGESIPVWKINNTLYHSILLPAYHWSGSNGTELIVLAVPGINNTEYQCQVTPAPSKQLLLPQPSPAHLIIDGNSIDNPVVPKTPPIPLQVIYNNTAQSLKVTWKEPLTTDSVIKASPCDSLDKASASFNVFCSELVVTSLSMQGIVMLQVENFFDMVVPPGVADSIAISLHVSSDLDDSVPVLDFHSQLCFDSYLSDTGCFDYISPSYLIATSDSVAYCTIDSCGTILKYQVTGTSPEKKQFCLNPQFAQTNILLLFNSVNLQEVTIQEYCPKSLTSTSCGNTHLIHFYGNRAILPLQEPSISKSENDCSTVCSFNALMSTSSHGIVPLFCLSTSVTLTLLPTNVIMTSSSTIADTKATMEPSLAITSQLSLPATSSSPSVSHTPSVSHAPPAAYPINQSLIIIAFVILGTAILITTVILAVISLSARCCRGGQYTLESVVEDPHGDNTTRRKEHKLLRNMRPTMKQFQHLEIINQSGERQTLNIVTLMASRWRELGLQLDILPQKLESYYEDYHHVETCCARMLGDWIRFRKDCQWSFFLEALEGLHENALLDNLNAAFSS